MIRPTTWLTRACFVALGCVLIAADSPQDPKGNGRRPERAAASYLTHAFPRTRGLMDYLRREHPKTYQTLLEHSRTAARKGERKALQFVRENHPELAEVLTDLRKRGHRGYRSALREVLRDTSRLAQSRRRTPDAYRSDLAVWKNRSRTRLYAAQLAAKKQSEVDEGQLRQLVEESVAARRSQLEQRAQRMREQLERIERTLQASPDVQVEQQLDSIRKKIQRRRNR